MQESLLMVDTELKNIDGLGELVDGVRFWGEVPTNRFINATSLASAIGLTAGTAQHTNEPWLHFELDGKTLYVAKKPYRYNLSWNQINASGAVFGTRTIVINGLTYRVRLLRGADVNPTPANFGWNPAGTHTSEWNRLIYSVHNGVHTDSGNQTPPGHWPLYSDTDLAVHATAGNGGYNWCQETNANNTSQRIRRGYGGVSHFSFGVASSVSTNFGWRPVLELIP